MKTALDPRHLKRVKIVQSLYSVGFEGKRKPAGGKVKEIYDNLEFIDNQIVKCAPQWPIEQINRVDLAILRLAIYELKIVKEEPVKVIIDEAIELAKEFGSEASPAFINGVLGAALKTGEQKETESVSTEIEQKQDETRNS